jgi:hypothetical protein
MLNNPHRVHMIIDRLHDLLNYPMKESEIQSILQIIAGELNGIAMSLKDEYEEGKDENSL